ncbi:MAG: hypothetical protein Q8922_13160 [Bacteroidota bacterium]|nr:hypothetical protein [Bacteroidota bacterium]MDP4232769.1 hypothetical protein [Bacteroidota bacterium]MDP4242549.1 hypothetical protein [Bacteroidota bacterium]MDP4288872.1 hypothetical protein [Bacteroidota bacterium]
MATTFKEKIADTLNAKAGHLARERGLHLLRIEVRGTEQNPVIEVLLDGDRLVAISDCETVSKELATIIDAERLVKGNYRLDVMSPGIEEPLVYDWQFARSIGHLVEVHYRDGDDHHTLHGHLRESSSKEIAIEPIHLKGTRSAARTAVTDEGPVELKADEQLYEKPVQIVKIQRGHLTKVVVQPEMGRK